MTGGKRGPPPLPTKVKLLHGERHHDRLNFAEPMPRDKRPQCPEDAGETTRAIFEQAVEELEAMQIAYSCDRDALRVYADAIALHRRVSVALDQSPVLIRGSSGAMVNNPLLKIQRDTAALIHKFAGEFGFTPSSRTRIETNESSGNEQAGNPFAGTG